MTSSEFLARYPEFKTVGTALLNAALADALAQIDASIYGSKKDLAQGLLAAHLLAISPFGRSERTEPGSQTTLYWEQYQAVLNQVAPKFIVV